MPISACVKLEESGGCDELTSEHFFLCTDGRVAVEALPRGVQVRVGGAFTPERTPAVLRGELLLGR